MNSNPKNKSALAEADVSTILVRPRLNKTLNYEDSRFDAEPLDEKGLRPDSVCRGDLGADDSVEVKKLGINLEKRETTTPFCNSPKGQLRGYL